MKDELHWAGRKSQGQRSPRGQVQKEALEKGEVGAGTSEGRVATLKKFCFGDRNKLGVVVEGELFNKRMFAKQCVV